jgi:hypothetical protein
MNRQNAANCSPLVMFFCVMEGEGDGEGDRDGKGDGDGEGDVEIGRHR